MSASSLEELEVSAGRVALPPWPFLETLPAALEAGADRIAAFREALTAGGASLAQRLLERFLPRHAQDLNVAIDLRQ